MNAIRGPVERLLDTAERIETEFDAASERGRLVWHRWGAGSPVVLLHGGAGSWRHWVRNVSALLGEGRAVWAPDLPGLGESSPPPRPYQPGRAAEIVATGLASLLPECQDCDLVGFSFGAVIAGHLAARHPGLVRRLVLVGAGALGVKRASIDMVPVRDQEGPARVDANRRNLLALMIADPAKVDALALSIQDWHVDHARVNSLSFASSTALLDVLSQVRCPFGAIWGEFDHPAGALLPDRIAALRSIRPELPIEVIAGAGHWVAFEAADAFNAALSRMLAGLHG